jgi:hypothetical protein
VSRRPSRATGLGRMRCAPRRGRPAAVARSDQRHVDDSFDEFRFLQFGHGLIPSLEFVARQPIPWLQGWDDRRGRPANGQSFAC